MKTERLFFELKNQRGVSAVLVAVCLVMLIGFIALSIDVSHLVVARNELQNAADAGALAGAGDLYTADGTAINTNANQIGYDAAVANRSEQVPVEVNWNSGNVGDVQRGHWSFATRTFTPNDSTAPVELWGVTTEELDANPHFINAVRVRARRQSTSIASWFSGIFGITGFEGFAEAIAYIGFAGTLAPGEVDAPIAICKQRLFEIGGGKYDCTEGRFINDAAGGQDEETGMWTSFDQHIDPITKEKYGDPCQGGTNNSEVRPLVIDGVCNEGGANSTMLWYKQDIEVNNGQISDSFNRFYNCWANRTDKIVPLTMKLPVIDCSDDPTTCAPLVGAVTVNVIWVTQNPNYRDIPEEMTYSDAENTISWQAPLGATDEQIWADFASEFNLIAKGDDGQREPASYQAKTIYFLPSCNYEEPAGLTGGENFGVLAKIPVLVD